MLKLTKYAQLFLIMLLLIEKSNGAIATYKNNTDITDQFNQDITFLAQKGGGTLIIPAGNFYINSAKSIILKNNINIILNKNTILHVIPNNLKSYQVFRIYKVNKVSITGGTIIGDKYTHKGNAGEWGMGIDIRGSSNVFISKMDIRQMWGDAIYMSASDNAYNNNILISSVNMDDNRRQGVTIVSGNNLVLEDLTIANTKGVSPSAGIDIEPNKADDQLNNITLKNIKTKENKGAGIQIGIQRLNNPTNKVDIKIINHNDDGSRYGMLINERTPLNAGTISVIDSKFSRNKEQNFCMRQRLKNNITINMIRPSFSSKSILTRNYFCRTVDTNVITSLKAPSFN